MLKVLATGITFALLFSSSTTAIFAAPGQAAQNKEQDQPKRVPIIRSKDVLSLQSLTADQKNKIQAAYQAFDLEIKPIQEQIRSKKEATWTKVQAILKPSQIAELEQAREAERAEHQKEHPHKAKKDKQDNDSADD